MSACFQLAGPEDSADILRLFRDTPQRGRVVINFEREPDYFLGGRVICEQPEVHISRGNSGELVMLYAIGRRTLYINGLPTTVRYAHDLRLAEQARGGRMILRMARYVGDRLGPEELIQTVILNENRDSLNSVASGRAGLPGYYPCGDIETSLVFRMPAFTHHDLLIRPAEQDDVGDMQAFHDRHAPDRQFYPRYCFADIGTDNPYYAGLSLSDYWLAYRGSELVGMAALWDQKAFKQTRVVSYPPGLSGLRHLWNLWSRLFGGLHLPPAGGTLRYLMLHSVLVRNDEVDVLRALLSRMSRHAGQQQAALSAGFFVDDPLRHALRGSRRQLMGSRHYLIGYFGDPRSRLDGRRGYIELARL